MSEPGRKGRKSNPGRGTSMCKGTGVGKGLARLSRGTIKKVGGGE